MHSAYIYIHIHTHTHTHPFIYIIYDVFYCLSWQSFASSITLLDLYFSINMRRVHCPGMHGLLARAAPPPLC